MKEIFIILLLPLLLPGIAFSQSDGYLWPTDASRYLTSTFGETRSAHFHAGLDIKTWGREGYRVFATKKGTLYRLSIKPNGYGKVVYLKHDDGTISLYAHLQRFAPRFQQLADSLRLPNFSFELDTTFHHKTIPVKQGELVGYTGSTGVGPPHLHFELRDSLGQPVNALQTDLTINDELPPVFSELFIEPLSPGFYPELVKPQPGTGFKQSEYNFGKIPVKGPSGFAIDVYDEVRGVHNKYAAYELLLIHESDTLFHSALDYFNYSDESQMFIDRASSPSSSRIRFQRLYLKDGNTLPFYKKAENIHEIPLRTGKFTIVAKDFFGNSSNAVFELVEDTTTYMLDNNTAPRCFFYDTPSCYWTESWISTSDGNYLDLKKVEAASGLPARLFYPEKNPKSEVNLFYSDEDPQRVSKVIRIYPEKASYLQVNQNTSVYFPKKMVFDTLSFSITASDSSIQLLPGNAALAGKPLILHYIQKPEVPLHTYGLYKFDANKDEYDYIESEIHGNTLWAYPAGPGRFVIKADTIAPSAFAPTIRTLGKQEVISFGVYDDLPGLDHKNSSVFINGQRGILEYEPEDDRITFYYPGIKFNDTNIVELHLSDKAGNKAIEKFTVEK